MIHRVRRADPDAGAELRFQRLLENAPDLIYRYRVASPRGYDYINAACIAITGHPPDAFYADPALALTCVHPDDRHIIVQAFQDDPTRLQLAIRIRWVHPDGRIVCAEHRRVPVLDRHGRIAAIEGVGRDITANLEIETQLRESERQLKRLAASMQSAREEERAHLSRELHDELGQTLTILNMDLTRTVRDLIPLALPPNLVDRMQSMVGNIDLATVMIESQKASVSFRALTEVRNRLVTVYQDIMNMPI